jgi:hypothetical protein
LWFSYIVLYFADSTRLFMLKFHLKLLKKKEILIFILQDAWKDPVSLCMNGIWNCCGKKTELWGHALSICMWVCEYELHVNVCRCVYMYVHTYIYICTCVNTDMVWIFVSIQKFIYWNRNLSHKVMISGAGTSSRWLLGHMSRALVDGISEL